MRADELYPKYPEYRADLPHHYPPPPSFDQRYVPILSSVARISNRLTGLMQTFTFLTSQDPGPGQSRAVGLGPQPGPPLLSDPQPHNQVGQKCYFKTFQLLCYSGYDHQVGQNCYLKTFQLLRCSGYDHHQYESLSSPPQDAVWQAWKRAQVLTISTKYSPQKTGSYS